MTSKQKEAIALLEDASESLLYQGMQKHNVEKIEKAIALLSEQEGREVDLEFDGPFGIKCPECSRAIARHSSPEQCSGCGTKLIWPNTDEQGEAAQQIASALSGLLGKDMVVEETEEGKSIRCSAKKVGG